MSRRRLWALTALACAAIVTAGTPALRDLLWAALRRAAASDGPLGVPWDTWAFGAAAALFAVLLAQELGRRWHDPRAQARRAWRRGESVAAISRRLQLPQDMVRQLLPGSEPRGMDCRPGGAPAESDVSDFAGVLRRSAVGTTP